jgi:hypothetical protein
MKCPYCDKVAPAKLDANGEYWTYCAPCGQKGKGVSNAPAKKETAKAKKPRSKKSKPSKVDNVDDAPIGESEPDQSDLVYPTDG